MAISTEQLLQNVDADIARLRAELGDAETFRRNLVKYAKIDESTNSHQRMLLARALTNARTDQTKKARVLELAEGAIMINGPMTARKILEYIDSRNERELAVGATDEHRISTISSIMSRAAKTQEVFVSTPNGYDLVGKTPAQDGNPERAEQHVDLL